MTQSKKRNSFPEEWTRSVSVDHFGTAASMGGKFSLRLSIRVKRHKRSTVNVIKLIAPQNVSNIPPTLKKNKTIDFG